MLGPMKKVVENELHLFLCFIVILRAQKLINPRTSIFFSINYVYSFRGFSIFRLNIYVLPSADSCFLLVLRAQSLHSDPQELIKLLKIVNK